MYTLEVDLTKESKLLWIKSKVKKCYLRLILPKVRHKIISQARTRDSIEMNVM